MFGFGKSSRQRKPSAKIVYDSGLPGGVSNPAGTIDKRVKLDGRKSCQAQRMQSRIWLSASVFILIFSGLAVRLVDITLLKEEAETPVMVAIRGQETVERPDVTDRKGRHLIMTRPTKGAAIEVRDVWNKEDTATRLSEIFPKFTEQGLLRRLQTKKYIVLSEELEPLQEERLMKQGLPGVVFFTGEKRVYPQGQTAAHVVGYVEPGRGGRAGLEAYLNEPQYEPQVAASIDLTVQQILEQELAATVAEFEAYAAWGIVMDVRTGEVVALANVPTYNPNDLTRSEASTWRNRAMQDRYELGSAFKILTAAAALEEGASTPEARYDVRHPLPVADRKIYDYKPKGGFMNLSEVLQYSSNIGIAQVALAMGGETQKAYFEKLGLMASLETELPELRAPDLPAKWGPVEVATVSYGHGIAVTPLQLTAAIAAAVNGGEFVTPTFLKTDKPVASSRVFSEQTSANLRLMLRRVVTDGTARNAETPGYYVIGKTATADKPSLRGGYEEDARISSFVGAFPGYDPQYVMLVSFDEPKPTAETYGYATAGVVAAPAFKRIVARAAPALGIAPVNDDVAFAKFMSSFRSRNIQLAMNAEDVHEVETDIPADDAMAKFISELGP
jgi:cell division protein FtsI (penicillin-binding protein 3)